MVIGTYRFLSCPRGSRDWAQVSSWQIQGREIVARYLLRFPRPEIHFTKGDQKCRFRTKRKSAIRVADWAS